MESQHSDIRERIAFGMKLATQQEAAADVIDELLALHADALAVYKETPAESAKLGPTPEAAALALVANTLLNLDSALNR
jgi:hypothetical protein